MLRNISSNYTALLEAPKKQAADLKTKSLDVENGSLGGSLERCLIKQISRPTQFFRNERTQLSLGLRLVIFLKHIIWRPHRHCFSI